MSSQDVVWEFDGGDGRTDILMSLVAQQVQALDDLLPEEHEDPMARLAAEFSQRPVELLDSSPVLSRLFPPAMDDAAEAVPRSHLDAWITTLGGLRAAWTVELTGSAERMATASPADVRKNPTAATVCDWLGWVLEDVLEAHMFLS